jgi:hypothetical protein
MVATVAATSEVAITPCVHDHGERCQAQCCHPNTIYKGVYDDLPGEDTLFLLCVSRAST